MRTCKKCSKPICVPDLYCGECLKSALPEVKPAWHNFSIERRSDTIEVPTTREPIQLAAVKDHGENVKHQLKEMTDRADEFAGVILLAKNKNGDTYMRISTMTQGEKAELFCLFQSFIVDLFKPEELE